jgi:Excalibur calcium-binding domain
MGVDCSQNSSHLEIMLRISVLTLATTLLLTVPVLAKGKKPKPAETGATMMYHAPVDGAAIDSLNRFKTCKEANRAGVSNIPVPPGYTPPGWNHSADRDRDGVACEKR